jgi:aminoglycoside phosphotransferase (APT) family kinase protein
VRVVDSFGATVVLRRAPDVAQPGTYNLARENALLTGLARTKVPAPAFLAYCSDLSVWGAEFSVVEYMAGRRIATVEEASSVPELDRQRIGRSLIETLAIVNSMTAREMGLEQFVRGNYLTRQLARWSAQVAAVDSPFTQQFVRLRDQLQERLPAQVETSLLHGDFRLDNCLVAPNGAINAVLDWELATFGDPLADLALLYVYWAYPGSPNQAGIGLPPAPTALPGFGSRDRLLATYESASGRTLPDLDPYLGFAHWKVACITQGVLWRYAQQRAGVASATVVRALEDQIRIDLDSAVTYLG